MTALNKAIEVCGSQKLLAEKLEVGEPNICRWKSTRMVPANHCLKIQEITKNAVTVHDLRPDIFGPQPSSTSAA